MQLTINSFRPLFPDNISYRTFHWQLSKSLTFSGFPYVVILLLRHKPRDKLTLLTTRPRITVPPSHRASSSSSFLACNLRLRSAIRRHHPPQRAVLSQICCSGECKMVMFQILLDGAEPCDAGTTQLSSPVCWRGGQQDPLGMRHPCA